MRASFDKVISYDASSLIDGLNEKENKSKNAKHGGVPIVPKIRQRPVTSKNANAVSQSLNDQFNKKLI